MIYLHPPKASLPHQFQLSATKKHMGHGFLLVTKTTFQINLCTKFKEHVLCRQPVVTGKPKNENNSRPDNVLIHSLSPINQWEVIFQQYVGCPGDGLLFHGVPSL
jgi:hypothetical protein